MDRFSSLHSIHSFRTFPFVKTLLLTIGLLLQSGCNSIADQAPPTEEEKQLLRAYSSLAVFHDSFPPTTNRDSIALYQSVVDSILDSYNLSQEEFRREFEQLLNSPERFQPLFQELSSEIQQALRKR